MKLKEMTSEQRREYNRIQKQQQRDREREKAAAKRIPNANDFEMPEAKQKLLDQHSSEILKTVQAELPDHKFATEDKYVVEAVAHVLFGLENNIVQSHKSARNARWWALSRCRCVNGY
jgi:FKBP-type peptidyl-prolyl cis-trans isomerase (trigger factor)